MTRLDDNFFDHAIKRSTRNRIKKGDIRDGDDVVVLRKFLRMTQEQFALALGISVATLRGWEQGQRLPRGPSLALLSIAARHPHIIEENLREVEAA